MEQERCNMPDNWFSSLQDDWIEEDSYLDLEPSIEEMLGTFDKPETIFKPQDIGPEYVVSSNVVWIKYTGITEYEGLATIGFWWGGVYEYYTTLDVFKEIAYYTSSPGNAVWRLLRRRNVPFA